MVSLWRIAGQLIALRFLSAGWRRAGFAAIGVVAGLGLFVLHASRAASYLSDAPETCMNCHVMTAEYISWRHSSHAGVATCDDCHVPHTSLAAKYAFKARDGLWHSTVFTMRWEPQAIRISERAIPVVEENCRRCHAELISDVSIAAHQYKDLRCWDCHRETPHGTVRSLSAAPDIFRPRLPEITDPLQEPTVGGRRPK
jgi:cytochrome c nitrite reductase small subunit